jgi:spore germination protein (amino acid permease)
MFSENRKISERQTTRLLVYDIVGISSLILPPALANVAGGDGIFCIFLALIPAYLFLSIVGKVREHAGTDYLEHIRSCCGKWVGDFFLLFYYLIFVILSGYVLYFLCRLVKMQLLKNESYGLIAICILVLGGYGILGGIEGKARIYEILFWFLMIPLLLMLILAVKDVNTNYWTPVFYCGWRGLFWGTVMVFLCYMLVYVVLFLFPHEKNPGQGIRSAKKAIRVNAILNSIIYLITLGIFGDKALAGMDYPVVTLMSMIKLPGGFLERQDAFMVAIWFFALYALMNSGMYYGTECLKGAIRSAGNKRYVLITMILTFASSYFFYSKAPLVKQYGIYIAGVVTVILILIPCLLLLHKKRNVGMLALVLVFLTCGLSGCSNVELEKRNFPLAVALDEKDKGYLVTLGFQNLSELASQNGKDTPMTEAIPEEKTSWYEAFAAVDANQPAVMDYNHVKVLILSSKVLDDKESLIQFLDYIKKQEVFSRNTLLYVSDEAAPVIAKNEKLKLPVGTYLAQMTEGEEELGKHGIVTLGNLINEDANRQENLYIPMLSEENKKPVITKYYVLSSFSSVGTVDPDTFRMAMLLENKMKKYRFQLDSGESVELSDIHVNDQITGDSQTPLEKIQIKAKARLQNESIQDGQKQQDITKRMEEYLQLEIEAVAKQTLESQKLDISNSFYRLGGYNRALYVAYHKNQNGYQKNLNYKINCSIQLIDE